MRLSVFFFLTLLAMIVTAPLFAADSSCAQLPNFDVLKSSLKQARSQDNGGLNNDMWGALVARDGTVCAVAYTGPTFDSQWPGSRSIAIEKANTANSFSLKDMALSTANLFAGAQPGGFLFGIAASNPVDPATMYGGSVGSFGTSQDPMVGKRASGIIVFGGGLALYSATGDLVGAVGVSGDTSCADHNIAWRTRSALKLDFVPKGPAPDKTDAIIYDFTLGKSHSGYGHPTCGNREDKMVKQLPPIERRAL